MATTRRRANTSFRKIKKSVKTYYRASGLGGVVRKRKKTVKRNRAAKRPKSVFLRNFTGRVAQNADKTISVTGTGRRGKAGKR